MPIEYGDTVARLVDQCAVEEAIQLAEWLQATPGAGVDLSGCVHLHAAVLQTILALRPRIDEGFGDARLSRWLGPSIGVQLNQSAPGGNSVSQWP
jgi:hypothetical protein